MAQEVHRMPLARLQLPLTVWSLYAAAFTAPLYGVSFFRLELGIYHLAIPSLFLLLTLLALLSTEPWHSLWQKLQAYRPLPLLTTLILAASALALTRSLHLAEGIKLFLKTLSSLGFFWTLLLAIPNDKAIKTRLLGWLVAGTTLLSGYLLYYYAFVFRTDFLGVETTAYTRIGKNHFAWILVITLPYALLLLQRLRGLGKVLLTLASALIFLCIIYSQSRSAWLALAGIATSLCLTAWQRSKRQAGILLVYLCGFSLMTAVVLPKIANLNQFLIRAQSIYEPQTLTDNPTTRLLGKNTYNDRSTILRETLRGIQTAPLFGIGLGNRALAVNQEPHNDTLGVWLETGLLGALPFMATLLLLGLSLWRGRGDDFNGAALASYASLLLMSVFISLHPSGQFWFFLALALRMGQPGGNKSVAPVTA